MLPWNTCGDTQGLVRTFIQPSSIECNFMSQRTTQLSDSRRRAPVERRGDDQITRDSQTESAAAVRCSALVRPCFGASHIRVLSKTDSQLPEYSQHPHHSWPKPEDGLM